MNATLDAQSFISGENLPAIDNDEEHKRALQAEIDSLK